MFNGNTTAITSENDILIELSWYDYGLFALMLGSSALIGVYFGYCGKKQSSRDEYLLGSKEMKVLPVALSLIASAISGSSLLALPTDVYSFGSTYIFHLPVITLVTFLTYVIYIPVFYKLQLTSTYEYLELRFNVHLRRLTSFLFALSIFLFMPIVIYAPALAFAQATGTNLYVIATLVSVICVFYTTIGGLKAVIWTDALQFILMLAAIAGVTIMGIISCGGLSAIYNASLEGGRLSYNFNLDPTKRDTVWAILIGSNINSISHISIGQGYMQKYLSLPKRADVKKALIWFALGGTIIIASSIFMGLMIYTKYRDCDPLKAERIGKSDQILALFIMEVSEKIPGLSGLYLAGLFSAALSTLSAFMNCLSGTIYEDFVSNFMPRDTTEKQASNMLKVLVVIIGTISTVLIFVVEKMGSLLPIQFALFGITSGALVGLFTLGLVVPFANSKGALAGGLCSLIIMTIIIGNAQYYQAKGAFQYEPLPTSVEGCPAFLNITSFESITMNTVTESNEPFFLFRISHYYYAMLGTIIVFLVALPVSYFTKTREDSVDSDLIVPFMHWAIKKPKSRKIEYLSVDEALQNMHANGFELKLNAK